MTISDGADPDADISRFVPKRNLTRQIQREWARFLQRKTGASLEGWTSLALANSGLADHLNDMPRHVVNLHWINSDFISIGEIGRIVHPVVWTLHDMWPFCGAEHYSEADAWKSGYAEQNGGFDLNRWVWRRKRKHWKRKFHIVVPSRWMGNCVSDSDLMGDWPVHVIPNAIDSDLWAPMDRAEARVLLKLPPDVPLVLFGAMGGSSDPRKGFEHLRAALLQLHAEGHDLRLLIFGGDANEGELPFPVHSMGAVSDPAMLRAMYAAADVFALPSRQDNLPNTGVEALSCGTPIVGFKTGGLPDLVPSPDIGYLAKPFDPGDLARGIAKVLGRQSSDAGAQRSLMSEAARNHAVATYAQQVVAKKYGALYHEILQDA
ncbi:MAG: glycosyltransferase [Sedimentitalea sp.]|uniref:glycosyltransferase n=1 Tax=Sedimentitalea sp. TaxID=2048915 RepID=UPI0032656583